MKATLVVPVAVFACIALFYIRDTGAIRCYVCQDCDDTYNASHLINCTRTQDKCAKIHLVSGDVDRACADKNRCGGRTGRTKRSIEEELEDSLPKRRVVRQLLGGGSSGDGGNKNKQNGKDKQKEKQKEEKKGIRDALEIHCCAEDSCNGVEGLSSSQLLLLFVLTAVGTASSLSYFRVN